MLLADWFFFVLFHMIRIAGDILSLFLSPFVFLYYSYKTNSFSTRHKVFKTVFITGGSSGIGKATATEFLKQNDGDITLILTGRNKKRLASTQKELEQLLNNTKYGSKGRIITHEIDACNKDEMKEYIQKMDSQYKIDLIIANAGISTNSPNVNSHYFASSRLMLDINCVGVLNTILPIVPLYQERKKGHIAVVGSLASYVSGATELASYAGTKAYIRYICDDLRPKLKMIGNIDVTYIAPGFVESGMAPKDKFGHLWGFMGNKEASKWIVTGLQSNKSIIMFPLAMANTVWVLGSLHPIIVSIISRLRVNRHTAVQDVGFFAEVDPNDEFGGEC